MVLVSSQSAPNIVLWLRAVHWLLCWGSHAPTVILKHPKFSASFRASGVLPKDTFSPTSMRITAAPERMRIPFLVLSITSIPLLVATSLPSNRKYSSRSLEFDIDTPQMLRPCPSKPQGCHRFFSLNLHNQLRYRRRDCCLCWPIPRRQLSRWQPLVSQHSRSSGAALRCTLYLEQRRIHHRYFHLAGFLQGFRLLDHCGDLCLLFINLQYSL